ncbi:hypothetical protein BBP40_011091 [Aspergillus hancockii]|nr:hypothetical protein BBP40_011091 [Aspergillus hancockii]
MVTWMVDLALNQNPGKNIRISSLVVRLTLIIFLPVDVFIAMTEHFFLDLLSSDPASQYYQTLREEAITAFTSQAISEPTSQSMPQMESAIPSE